MKIIVCRAASFFTAGKRPTFAAFFSKYCWLYICKNTLQLELY